MWQIPSCLCGQRPTFAEFNINHLHELEQEPPDCLKFGNRHNQTSVYLQEETRCVSFKEAPFIGACPFCAGGCVACICSIAFC